MAPTSYSIWSEEDYDSPELMIDCLLPTGILVPLLVRKYDTMATIKQDLWKEAKKFPLFERLSPSRTYIFVCINESAVKVELVDETKRLSDVRPFQPLLKVIPSNKLTGQQSEKVVNAQINVLLGKVISDLDFKPDSEVSDFRLHMREMCEQIARDKEAQGWLERAMCLFPPDVIMGPDLPEHLKARLEDGMNLLMNTRIDDTPVTYKFSVAHTISPEELIRQALDKRTKNTGTAAEDASAFVLKVCGRQEYLLGDFKLFQFVYIRKMIRLGMTPDLTVVKRSTVSIGEPPQLPPRIVAKVVDRPRPPPVAKPTEEEALMMRRGHCILDLTERFQLTLHSVTNVNVDKFFSVNVRACLYHGGETLCSIVNSASKMLSDSQGCMTASWNDGPLIFDLALQNVPRMARLCLLLYMTPDKRVPKTRPLTSGGNNKRFMKRDITPLAWVNIPVFNYKGVLRTNEHKLFMWSITDDDILFDELLNPIGTVESNPQTDDATCLTISFDRYNLEGSIYYPPFDKIIEVAAKNALFAPSDSEATIDRDSDSMTDRFKKLVLDPTKVKPQHLIQLRLMIDRDPLEPLDEQDKELIWSLRYECREHFPQSLPKLLCCVHWDDYNCVAVMQALLQIWPKLPPTDALELLDYQYSDNAVRRYAVNCLEAMSDTEICHYLLQFVQVLKYESYLECDLITFLLQRALNNKKIGHYFFWLLRSEMHVPSVSVRFSLILEAYCRGSIHHLAELNSEIEVLHSLRLLSEHIQVCSKQNMTKDKLKEELQKRLSNQYKQSMMSISNPLDPCLQLKTLIVGQCKSMMSKMRPLWLVWENADKYGDTTYFIYKTGDDLRQDMLSLQMLRIMDNIWQADGLDLRLNAYGCLSTGHSEGLIEIVTEAQTIANIQKEEAPVNLKAGFNKECLYQWLKKKHPTERGLSGAVDEFILSCAGYCVATYVLGVADRHSDNIMLRENGQLFHIDFGHILGHFKSKYGVKRERVPFVLTTDFVYVINHGNEKKIQNFERFRELCERAFLALRRRSRFLMTLFMMMMNTGIPEVSCIKDIEYLKETLVPHLNEAEAIAHFRAKFKEALASSWKTSINWWIHNMHCNNKN